MRLQLDQSLADFPELFGQAGVFGQFRRAGNLTERHRRRFRSTRSSLLKSQKGDLAVAEVLAVDALDLVGHGQVDRRLGAFLGRLENVKKITFVTH